MQSLEVEVEVGEAYIGRVRPGMPTQTVLNAYQDWKIPGHVIAIIPAADRGKATVKVRVSLDAKGDPRIVPDMGARVSFLDETPAPAQRTPGVLVPARAITARGGKDVAFVVQDGKAVQRRAHLGAPWATTARCSRGWPAASGWCSTRPRPWPTAHGWRRRTRMRRPTRATN